jgi:TRAP-type C4-dicarboxylate transport system permease small subunit
VEGLRRFQIFLTRYEVFPGWDAWTLIPAALLLLALVAAFVWYGWSLYRRLRSPDGVDWDRELGGDGSPMMPENPRDRLLTRLKLAAFSLLTIFMGVGALSTGHFSSNSHGRSYSADGAPALVAGGILCAAGLLLGIAALFPDAKLLNRSFGGRRRLP